MKNHQNWKSKILTIAILPSLLMSLESENIVHYIAQLRENDPSNIYKIMKEFLRTVLCKRKGQIKRYKLS